MSVTSAACRSFMIAAALLVFMAIPAMSAPAPTPVKWTVSGYVQARYSDTIGDTSSGSFDARRASITLRVDVDEKSSAVIQANGFSTTSLLEAYGEYRVNPEFKTRFGLNRIPFGYELPLSSSKLITLERSQVVTALLSKDFTYDRGITFYYAPAKSPVSLSAGLTNGEKVTTAADSNSRKNVVARLGYTLPKGQIGISAYAGDGPSGQTMQRTGIDAMFNIADFTILGEALTGKGTIVDVAGETDAQGGYLTLAYRKKGSAVQPFLRVEKFDPDTDTADDDYSRQTVGANYILSNSTKVTLEYQNIDDKKKPDVDSAIAAQYQITF